MRFITTTAACLVLFVGSISLGQPAAVPATRPAGTDKMPGVHVDIAGRQLRVDCEAINVEAPLEFLCVTNGGNEHESLLRTPAKPSHIHLGLLMLGLEPGEPVHYMKALDRWAAPQGPPLNISIEYAKDGQTVRVPAYKLFRDLKTKKPMPLLTWVFVGSRFQENNVYAADLTGYVVSVVNFDLTLIDVPEVASSSNELLEWEMEPANMPPKGSKVTMIIEPAGQVARLSGPAAAATQPAGEVHLDQAKIDQLRQRWNQAMAPSSQSIQRMAQEHYEIMQQLRAEQARLVNEAERVSRVIEELQKQYNDMVTPRPGQGTGNPNP
jgi:hypothetical protein